MKIVAPGFGDLQLLQAVPTENPPPGRGEVSIQVRAAGVNHRDLYVPDSRTSKGFRTSSGFLAASGSASRLPLEAAAARAEA